MKLIAAVIPAHPLDVCDMRALLALRERHPAAVVIALIKADYDSRQVQERLLRTGAADIAIVCRRFSPEIVARLIDADEVLTL